MFDLEQFAADCRGALREKSAHTAVREVVARGVSDPGAVLRTLGEPKQLYQSPDLTILNVIWAPWMTPPHNHPMWAVIGIYAGREDNIFWRRLPDGSGKVEAAGAKAICERDALPLATTSSIP
jgi:predicted metal-dependent enzyme (double-stranded beta helix superfamily)